MTTDAFASKFLAVSRRRSKNTGLGSFPKSENSHRLPGVVHERVLERILCLTRTRMRKKPTMRVGMKAIANARSHRLMNTKRSIVNVSIVQHVPEMPETARNVSITTGENAPAVEKPNCFSLPSITSTVEEADTTAKSATSPGGLFKKDFQTASRCYA